MIYFVDEDFQAFGSWIAELRMRGLDTIPLSSADDAFATLCRAPSSEVRLVIIDVMLAVENIQDDRFSVERTHLYLETGLRLLEDLSEQNPVVFPKRAALLTNTNNEATLSAVRRTCKSCGIPLWEKWRMASPMDFGDKVANHLASLGPGD